MQGSAAEGEALDFEPEDDDLMDEDGAPEGDASPPHSAPKLKSAITASSSLSAPPKKTKGRGFRHDPDSAHRSSRLSATDFDSLTAEGGPGPQRCMLYLLTLPRLLFSSFRFHIFTLSRARSSWFMLQP